ncbi:MAG: hypothetical protein U0232_07235 [Thermomicrobiales bacterium]
MSERTAPVTTNTFEPAKYLVNLNGKGEYLEVKWRLLWLRTEHPDAVIETELVRLEDRDAVFKARVSIPGGGSATGWGSESAGDFRDFLEKAETKAIGRALAALGFGTQFCHDHEFGVGEPPVVNVGQMRIVDTPVDLAASRGRRQAPAAQVASNVAAVGDPSTQRATERQVKFIFAIAREAGLDEQELTTWSQELYGQDVNQLNRRDASTLIEALQRRRNEVA